MPNTVDKAIIHEIAKFSVFRDFSQEQLLELCGRGEIRAHKHRETAFEHGQVANHFGLVLAGAYKLSRVSFGGEDTIVHFSSPGDVVAALVMAQAQPRYPVTVSAMGPSRMLVLSREVYLKSWLAMPILVGRIQELLSTRMGRFQNHQLLQRSPLRAKIAALLLNLVANEKGEDSLEIALPLTRKEIADSLGVTVESVIRVMSDWAKQGLVNTVEQRIRILNPEALVAMVHEPME